MASQAVLAARNRRSANAASQKFQDKWFIDDVVSTVKLSAQQRVKLATEWVRNRVVQNISIPVERIGSKVIRSVEGEFPRADTTQLMKTIYMVVEETSPGIFDGYVGTPLNYGLILETRMDRSFLVRTMNEESLVISKILNGPIK